MRINRIHKTTLWFTTVLTLLIMLGFASRPCPAAANEVNDAAITDAVNELLMEDPGVSSYWVDVTVSQGIVTLDGNVNNILAKDRAVKLARTVKGVRSVVNDIKVNAPLRLDTEIQEDVQDALLADAATEAWEITASVDDGVVMLYGTVDSWPEKQLAAKVAKGVTGVKGLENNINVVYKTHRLDSEIESEIEERLEWDALVDDALINVDVSDNEVTLAGTVGSAAEKNRAVTDAWVAGVEGVDASELNIESWAREKRFRKEKYVEKSDAKITDAVKDALLYDPRVYSFNVNVSVDGGIVTLSGEVDNLKARRAAAKTARNTVGVWSVKNNIRVRPSTPSDKKIENNIEQALLRDPAVSRYEITVTVTDNVAYLYGTVDTYYEKAEAEDVAAGIYGVVDVNNNLKVDNEFEPWVYDPYVDDLYSYDYDWYAHPDYTTTKNDWEIREDVEDELFWSPFVDEDEVSISVDDGVVTLSGSVDTWEERSRAEQQAYQGGAVVVDNDLAVEYGPDYYEP